MMAPLYPRSARGPTAREHEEGAPMSRARQMRLDRRSLLVGSLIALIAFGTGGCSDAPRAAAPPPPAIVKVTPVIERDVPISSEWVGTLVGYVDAQIRARVA